LRTAEAEGGRSVAKVEFEIDDGLVPIEGVAVIACLPKNPEEYADEDATPIVVPGWGEPKKHTVLGLLLGALDMARDQFREDWNPTED
jgi:hypothetical protein